MFKFTDSVIYDKVHDKEYHVILGLVLFSHVIYLMLMETNVP